MEMLLEGLVSVYFASKIYPMAGDDEIFHQLVCFKNLQ
jgi:hypothetical protein